MPMRDDRASETTAPRARLPLPEFVALMAFLFATVAFSIDSMLPSLPQIAAELTPRDVNRAQLVLTAFMAGMGVGTLLAGPISDAIGRKPAMTIGFLIYGAAAVTAVFARSLEMLLLARFVQGLGAAGPRIVGLAMIRDLYQGREMARIQSFVNMLFILIPAVAPSLGQAIIAVTGWRGIFAAFLGFALVGALWLNLRQPETLPRARRIPLRPGPLAAAAREVLGDRDVLICTATLALGFGQMFALLSSAQQLFGETYGRGTQFPLWFAAMALLSAMGTVLNARLVMRLGMRRMASGAYAAQVASSGVMLVLLLTGLLPRALAFPAFFLWAVGVFTMAGVTFGNLNGLALLRMGHVAGMAASLVSAVSTILMLLIAAPVGLLYDGTAVPVVTATLLCSGLAWWLMRFLDRDRG